MIITGATALTVFAQILGQPRTAMEGIQIVGALLTHLTQPRARWGFMEDLRRRLRRAASLVVSSWRFLGIVLPLGYIEPWRLVLRRLVDQGGRCWVQTCSNAWKWGRRVGLCLDHWHHGHRRGRPRGLLCHPHNQMLGSHETRQVIEPWCREYLAAFA
jgi:Recombination endonuclease VII